MLPWEFFRGGPNFAATAIDLLAAWQLKLMWRTSTWNWLALLEEMPKLFYFGGVVDTFCIQ